MNRPGDRLRAWASRWCCADTMAAVIDPMIADVQLEHAQALRSGRLWRSRLVRLTASIVFLKVLAICAWRDRLSPARLSADERKALIRSLAMACVFTAVLGALFEFPWVNDYPKVLRSVSPMRFLYLAPQSIALALTAGVTLGLVFGLAGPAPSRRIVASVLWLSVLVSVVSFVNVGWVTPAANKTFRERISKNADTAPNMPEMSLGELARKIDEFDRDPTLVALGYREALAANFHWRLALACSPVIFGAFVVALASAFRSRWTRWIMTCAAILSWGVAPNFLRPWDVGLPPYAAAWLPNLTLALLGTALVWQARRTTMRVSA
jgi:lipopolysaccharide export system permease LptF/LptG-like protein